MRQSERGAQDIQFPTRYTLDEARFRGGKERIFNKEDAAHEPTTDFT